METRTADTDLYGRASETSSQPRVHGVEDLLVVTAVTGAPGALEADLDALGARRDDPTVADPAPAPPSAQLPCMRAMPAGVRTLVTANIESPSWCGGTMPLTVGAMLVQSRMAGVSPMR